MRLRLGALVVFVALIATPVAGLVCAWTCATADDESGHAKHAEAICHANAHATVAGTFIRAGCCHDTALVAPAVAPEARNVLTPPALMAGLVWVREPSTPTFPAVVSWSVSSGDPPGARRSPVLRV